MNIESKQQLNIEKLLTNKFFTAIDLCETSLSRIKEFRKNKFENCDEKIAHLMPLINESCRNTANLCSVSRKIYQWSIENDRPEKLFGLINLIRNFLDKKWLFARINITVYTSDLFTEQYLPTKFTETEEILKETKKYIKNKASEYLVREFPKLYEVFKRLFLEKFSDIHLMPLVSSYLLEVKQILKENKKISATQMHNIQIKIINAFRLTFLQNKDLASNHIRNSITQMLLEIEIPPIFSFIYREILGELLEDDFTKFHSIKIDGAKNGKKINPVFFHELLNSIERAPSCKDYNISLTNLGLTDENFSQIIESLKNQNVNRLNLSGNSLSAKYIFRALIIMNCDRFIFLDNPLNKSEVKKINKTIFWKKIIYTRKKRPLKGKKSLPAKKL